MLDFYFSQKNIWHRPQMRLNKPHLCGRWRWRVYDFKQLSPADFEELTRDLLQKHWGVLLESFKTGKDQGIDLRYAGVRHQPTIVQCKHFAGSRLGHLLRELKSSELPKVNRLSPQRYVVVTSLPLSPAEKNKIFDIMSPHIKSTEDILGSHDLNNLLTIFPAVEQQHFKLWMSSTAVLERVLHNAEKVQTEFDIERIRRQIPLYVQTPHFLRAMKILEEQKLVIISGVPGIGKTTLANVLLYAHLEAGFEPVVIHSSIAEGKRQFKKESSRVFYFDDFLGDTFLGNRTFDFLGKKEDSAILDFMEMVRASKHARLIVTTREHILGHAFQISEPFRRRRNELASSRCVLAVGEYSLLDRGRILYNHIYFSDLPKSYRSELLRDHFYLKVLKHQNFNPRLVEWLSRHANLRAEAPRQYQASVIRTLDNPEELWRIAFEQQVSEASRSVLLALYSLGGAAQLQDLEEAWRGLHSHRSRKYNWTASAEDWRRSLQDLEGGFLSYQNRTATFINPSVKDFLDATLATNSDHFEDLITAAVRFEQLVVLWNLAMSEKGSQLKERLQRRPDVMMSAISLNLARPYERPAGNSTYSVRRFDVGPETRLCTLIAFADHTRSATALIALKDFVAQIIHLWKERGANFHTAAEALNALDTAKWPKIGSDVHAMLKSALLCELEGWASSESLAAIAEYASGDLARWSADDDKQLAASCRQYFSEGFPSEIADCGNVEELESLSTRLSFLGTCCKLDVRWLLDWIEDRIKEIQSDEEDHDVSVQRWAEEETESVDPEDDVKRLFDGLR